jgi:hypothetical protein
LWLEHILREAKVVSNGDSGNGFVFEIPARKSLDSKGGFDMYRVHFGENPDYMPIKIVGLRSDDSASITFTINEYQVVDYKGDRTYWPKSVTTEIMANKIVTFVDKTTIKKLDVGKDIPPEIFTLDFTSADVVWDDDLEMPVKTKNMLEAYTPEMKDMLMYDFTDKDIVSHTTTKLDSNETGVETGDFKHVTSVSEGGSDISPVASIHTSRQPRWKLWVAMISLAIGSTIVYFLIRDWISNSTEKKL